MIERTPMINTIALVEQLNAILELLEARGVEILDWENPDARLTHVENTTERTESAAGEW